MSYASILRNLPPEWQFTMLELVEAVEQNMRDQLAVRRDDFDLLTQSQNRVEQKVDRLEAALIELTKTQKRAEEKAGRLEAALSKLTEAQRRAEEKTGQLEAALIKLTEAQQRTEEEIRSLALKQGKMDDRLGMVMGNQLEQRYRERAYAYFGRLLRKPQAVAWPEIEDELEDRLTDAEVQDLALVDLLVRGNLRNHPEKLEVWLAIEISAMVDRGDVERAERRAGLLRKAGHLVVPAVAGYDITEGGRGLAQAGYVAWLLNGRAQFWQEALDKAMESV